MSLGSIFYKQQSIYPLSLSKDSFQKVSLFYNQHRFFYCEEDASCKIELSKYENINFQPYDVEELTISHKMTEDNLDSIVSYMGLDNEKDVNLIKTAITSDIQYKWFEFILRKKPKTVYSLRITGNRKIIDQPKKNFLIPEIKDIKLEIKGYERDYDPTEEHHSYHYSLNYKKLYKNKTIDPTMVVFFNSINIQSLFEAKTDLWFFRRITKLT